MSAPQPSHIETVVAGLDGATFEYTGSVFRELFTGTLQVTNVSDTGDVIRFDLIAPVRDAEDWIGKLETREQVSWSAQKVLLSQDDRPILGGHPCEVRAVAAEGARAYVRSKYVFTFELRHSALNPSVPLVVHARSRGPGWHDLAVATGRTVA